MTEEELYKKLNYIFGNNCLSEDVHKCDFDGSCESHEKVEFLKLIEEYSKQIRVEVIDKFAEEIKSLVYKWIESGVINVCTIDKIAEKLKE